MSTVIAIPCLRDNYAYVVPARDGSRRALIVDPGEASAVQRGLSERGLELAGILCTHHHADHVGGNAQLAGPGVPVIGHESEHARIPSLTRGVRHGETFELAGTVISVLHVPGHTLGAVAYGIGTDWFTGDTLFRVGCGRLFEGSAEQMFHSLTHTLGVLPDDVTVHTGHEYTEANLLFALSLEPNSETLQASLELVRQRRKKGESCASGTLGQERKENPFLRAHEPALARAMGLPGAEPVEVFRALRRAKDTF